MTSPANRWSDLDRPPLNQSGLRRALLIPGGLWTALDVVPVTGSTNTDLAARARDGAAEGAVLVAEEQQAGRGRLGRSWSAPARSGLFLSVLLRPGLAARGAEPVPPARWAWLPLLAGVATATAVARVAGVETRLKWPNDLLVTVDGETRKTGGMLAERVDETAVVLGIGINVTLRESELPVPSAGSLALAGAAVTDRDPLLRAVLRSLADWYAGWRAAVGDPLGSRLQETYAADCATLGLKVRAALPGGRELVGEAVAVDSEGRLVIMADGCRQAVSAGDVVHVRPAPPPGDPV